MPKVGPSTIKDRLRRIEGQVRAVEKMVENQEDGKKIIMLMDAVISSLQSTKVEIIKNEVRERVLEELDSAVDLLK